VVTVLASNDQITYHLVDSNGHPVLTTRRNECVETPKTPNRSPRLFRQCGDRVIIDRDEDGIYDDEDVCPNNSPAELSQGVYQSGAHKGCPIDSDGDGVPDYRDNCPQIFQKVDPRGCPLDTDQDGVFDDKDLCPGTPEGAEVDEQGCAVTEPTPTIIVLPGDVTFASNESFLTPQAEATLDELVKPADISLIKNIEIVGYTDSQGAEEYNQNLSEQRAASVADYLIKLGVPDDKISQWGEGEFNPIESNDTQIGRAKNRRVELKITRLKMKYPER
jgi:OOP family OmpA-OmpF porin